VRDGDKAGVVELARRLVGLEFEVLATGGTHAYLAERGISPPGQEGQGGRPSIVDRIKDGDVHFVINTTDGKRDVSDSSSIRRETLMKAVPYFTTMTGARAGIMAMEAMRDGPAGVRSLQEYHGIGAVDR